MWAPNLWRGPAQPDAAANNPGRGGSGSGRPAGSFASLKDKSVEELKALLTNQQAYKSYFYSIDLVASADKLRTELQTGNLEQAVRNLSRESEIAELRNQCMIIRTTELATAQEKFAELQQKEQRVQGTCSPAIIIEKLRKAGEEVDRESTALEGRFMQGELEMSEFMAEYKKLRQLYQVRSITRQAALGRTSFRSITSSYPL